MANNYMQATVTPYIHKDLITDEEADLLAQAGFECEGDDYLYFYVPEGYMDEIEVEGTDEQGNDTCEVKEIMAIFQDVIKRSQQLEPDKRVDEIVIEGAFTCDKMRQGEFGGFVTLITIDDVKGAGTADLLQLLREGKV